MGKDVVIISNELDIHADAISWALLEAGHAPARLLDTRKVIECQSTLAIESSGKVEINFAGEQISEGSVVYSRRSGSFSHEEISQRGVDPEDVAFAAKEFGAHSKNAVSLLGCVDGVDWINPMRDVINAENKILQTYFAGIFGLCVPETISSNKFEDVCDFARRHGPVIVKPHVFYRWIYATSHSSTFATTVSIEQLVELGRESIEATPAIYQRVVSKVADIRVVCVGSKVFALLKRPIAGSFGAVDLRLLEDADALYEEVPVPDEVCRGLLGMMGHFGLEICAADFCMGEDGSWNFIELNPCGAYLYLDSHSRKENVLGTVCARLLYGKDCHERSSEFPSFREYKNSGRFVDFNAARVRTVDDAKKYTSGIYFAPVHVS